MIPQNKLHYSEIMSVRAHVVGLHVNPHIVLFSLLFLSLVTLTSPPVFPVCLQVCSVSCRNLLVSTLAF